jgi:hypothetical protein
MYSYSLQKQIFSLGLLVGAATLGLNHAALAFAPEGDLLEVKGYSPELVQLTDQQRSRQEWRSPSIPKQTPVEKFFHNIYYGEWTESVDDFGSQVLRDH